MANNTIPANSIIRQFPSHFCKDLAAARQVSGLGEEYFSLSAGDFLGMPNGWMDLRLLWPELNSQNTWVCRVGLSYVRGSAKTGLPNAVPLQAGQNGGDWVNFNTALIPVQSLLESGYLGNDMADTLRRFIRGEYGDKLRLIAGPDAFVDFSVRENINPTSGERAKTPVLIDRIAFHGFSNGNTNSATLQGFGRAIPKPAEVVDITDVAVSNPRRTYEYRLANGLLDQGSTKEPAVKAAAVVVDDALDFVF